MEIRPWSSDLAPATIDVLARAFAGNPLHVAAFGKESVVRRNAAFFQVGLSIFQGQRLAAMEGSKLVGFAHWVRSPACQMPIGQRLRLVPAMIHGLGLSGALRVSSWLSSWAKNDCEGIHSHFGPIGIDPDFQGRGVGGRLMKAFCDAIDAENVPGFLETDKSENVRFYEKFGFEVVREVPVIGVPTYFMTRVGEGMMGAA